jgi:iron complex transport system permease protein
LGDVLAILRGEQRADGVYQIIWNIRLPRLAAAGLLGAALALSGLLLQTLFGNPIAGPYVLGISSGAKLAVAVVMVVLLNDAQVMTTGMKMLAAFAGSLATIGCVLVAARRVRSASTLVIFGVMVGYVCSAATDLLVTFASDASVASLRSWSQGSFSGINAGQVGVMAVVVLVASAGVFALSKPLGAYQLGEQYAVSMGVDVRSFRMAVIALASLLAACATAFAGPISFVGVAVPHVVRHLLGTSKPLQVIPAAFLGGAVGCLACDLIARTLFAPTELSVSTVTALFGAPIVIWVLLNRRRQVG